MSKPTASALLAVFTLTLVGCGTLPHGAASPTRLSPVAQTLRAKSPLDNDTLVRAAITRRFTGTVRTFLINGEQVTVSSVSKLVVTPTPKETLFAFALTQQNTVTLDIFTNPAPIITHPTRHYTGTYDTDTQQFTVNDTNSPDDLQVRNLTEVLIGGDQGGAVTKRGRGDQPIGWIAVEEPW